jgi:hypothetical protein
VGNREIASIFLAISDSIRSLEAKGDFYNPLHPLVEEQKKKFSERIGTAAGLDGDESKRIIGEGMTLFCNTIPSTVIKEESRISDPWVPRILRQLELEIQKFLQDMPIIPHTDRKSVLMRTLTFLPVRQSLSN